MSIYHMEFSGCRNLPENWFAKVEKVGETLGEQHMVLQPCVTPQQEDVTVEGI
jgi:hypothetical protein